MVRDNLEDVKKKIQEGTEALQEMEARDVRPEEGGAAPEPERSEPDRQISDVKSFVLSWIIFLLAIVGPFIGMTVLGIDMNIIMSITTILMSGGGAVLYAYYQGMDIAGFDVGDNQRLAVAAGIGIFGGILSAIFGGGIVVAALALIVVLIGGPLMMRYGEGGVGWIERHEGMVAILAGLGAALTAVWFYLIGVPFALISVLIGVTAASLYFADVDNHYIGLGVTGLWIYYTAIWVLLLTAGNAPSLTWGANLLTSILLSVYVVLGEGYEDAVNALKTIPETARGDKWFIPGIVLFLLGAGMWAVAEFSGILSGVTGGGSIVFLFLAGLILGPVHLYWFLHTLGTRYSNIQRERGYRQRRAEGLESPAERQEEYGEAYQKESERARVRNVNRKIEEAWDLLADRFNHLDETTKPYNRVAKAISDVEDEVEYDPEQARTDIERIITLLKRVPFLAALERHEYAYGEYKYHESHYEMYDEKGADPERLKEMLDEANRHLDDGIAAAIGYGEWENATEHFREAFTLSEDVWQAVGRKRQEDVDAETRYDMPRWHG
ncbi:MAG: hypothetical protein SVW02_03730 [Candidatus Nanohaloarchaea archaeon]|nr:hypothetical protein [Candidatus Nanohaloarchaea archaeon]